MRDGKPPSPLPPGRWEQLFLAANRWILILLLATMAVLVIANVISRYVFLHSFTWVEEASRYLMIWAAFLGAGLALRVGGHIAVDSLPSALPPRGARWLRGFIAVVRPSRCWWWSGWASSTRCSAGSRRRRCSAGPSAWCTSRSRSAPR